MPGPGGMKRIVWHALLLGVACQATFLLAGDSTNPPTIPIIIDESLTNDAAAAWLGYALVRTYWFEVEFSSRHPEASEYQYSFDEELEARSDCAKMWRKFKKDQPKLKDKYLDELLAIEKAGFLREYVWCDYYTREWYPQPQDLKMEEFRKWAAKHLKNRKPETRAVAEIQGKPAPWDYDGESDTFTHRASKFRFPRRVAGFVRGPTTVFDPMGRDVSVGYAFAGPVSMSVYVFPNGLALVKQPTEAMLSERFDEQFKRGKWEIEQVHKFATLIDEGPVTLQHGSRTHAGKQVLFGFDEFYEGKSSYVHSRLYLFIAKKFFLKLRVTNAKAVEKEAGPAVEQFLRHFPWPEE